MNVTLSDGHQKDFFEMLNRGSIPKFLRKDLHSRPYALIHFCVALHAYCQISNDHKRRGAGIALPPIRRQMKTVTAGQIKNLCSAAFKLIPNDSTLRTNTLLVPFVCDENDPATAVHIIARISELLLVEDFVQNPPLEVLDLLLNLIGSQKESRTWNLYMEAVRTGNPEAEKAFRNLFDLWAANTELPEFKPIDNMKVALVAPEGACGKLQFGVPWHCAPVANRLFTTWSEQYLPCLDSFYSLMDSYWDNREEYQERANTMWKEIMEDASCDLRPVGDDTVDVGIKTMRDHGLRYIQMIPLDTRPNTLAVFWYETAATKRAYYVERVIDGPNLKFDECSPGNRTVNLVASFNKYLAISGIWSICLGHHIKIHVSGGTSTSKTSVEEHSFPRPHFRRIEHLGQKPSAEALERCERHYQGKRMPPQGKTFVKQHEVPHVFGTRVGRDAIKVVSRINDSILHSAQPNA